MTNLHEKIDAEMSDDPLASSLPARTGLYRSVSAKRSRDPSHRKSVSFNDVPTVHEVPLYDTVRNSGYDTYRSWTYTEATPAMSIISPFSSSPLHSSNNANHKLHANRLSTPLYSSTNRLTDWSTTRGKTLKITEDTIEQNLTWNPPLIIIHTPEERINTHSSTVQPLISENDEDKKQAYRSATVRHTEQSRTLPFTYVPLSESSTAYASMLSTNVLSSNQSSNDQGSVGNIRTVRARSATLPMTVVHSSTRTNDTNTITPTRMTTLSSRTVLKPATIDFQCTQPTTNISISKSSVVPGRLSSAAAHSRLLSTANRPLSSAIKYTFTHPPTLSRSRSANIIHTRRHVTSPVPPLDGQSEGTNQTNIYTSTKRNPNVRQTYGSYYTHHILLPADIN